MKKIIAFIFIISCSSTVKKNIPDSQKIKQINNTYWQSDKVEEKRTFNDGQYEFETKINGESCASCIEKAQIGKIVLGHLSDSEDKEGVAVIYSETGGSGTFVYLNLYVEKNGKMEQSGYPVFLGDRVKVKKVTILDKKVVVDLITHGKGEPLCCPTTKEVWKFKLVKGNLKKVKK
jgi:hypothetical protein